MQIKYIWIRLVIMSAINVMVKAMCGVMVDEKKPLAIHSLKKAVKQLVKANGIQWYMYVLNY